jgi:hypothetical protein
VEVRGRDRGEGHIIVRVQGKGKESDEESREIQRWSAVARRGRWFPESDVVLLWGGKGDGNTSFRCVDGRPRPSPVVNQMLDGARLSMWIQVLPSIVSNTYKGRQRQSKTKDKATDAR